MPFSFFCELQRQSIHCEGTIHSPDQKSTLIRARSSLFFVSLTEQKQGCTESYSALKEFTQSVMMALEFLLRGLKYYIQTITSAASQLHFCAAGICCSWKNCISFIKLGIYEHIYAISKDLQIKGGLLSRSPFLLETRDNTI